MVVPLGQDSNEDQCWQDQSSLEYSNTPYRAGNVLSARCDSLYLRILFLVQGMCLNPVDVDWAMHGVDRLARE
jgi:hypothetical protein